MKAYFKPRARLLKLLGDQLIGTPQLAVFELIKNSYDADAERVEVRISNPLNPQTGRIEITDFGGEGMDINVIKDVWLEPGADHKYLKRINGERTKKHDRLPLGEKGVGRFAVHKLGKVIELISKTEKGKEVQLKIDWEILDQCKYIEDAKIEITENDPPVFFKDGISGTKIVISKLNNVLEKSDVQSLYRNAISIQSPFEFGRFKIDHKAPSFEIDLSVEGHPEWTSDLHEMSAILEQALFRFSFIFENGKWSWDYAFCPNESLKKDFNINPRHVEEHDVFCEFEDDFTRKLYNKNREGFFKSLGPILGEIYVFDFDSALKSYYSSQGVVKAFMSQNQGIRVYRDGIRIYNYGEPDDDWLEMDGRRVNRLSTGLNRRITVGAIALDLEKTPDLIEKTNREGFIENGSFLRLKAAVKSALGKLEALRLDDKNRLRRVSKSSTTSSVGDFDNPLDELKELVITQKLGEEFQPVIARIEKRYDEMQNVMLTSGMAGLNMAIAFHELQHGIADARRNLKSGKNIEIVLEQFDRFELLLDTYANLLKSEKIKEHELKSVIKTNFDLSDVRFTLHDIITSCPLLVGDEPNYSVELPKNLMVSAINNLIDNSIYWLDQRWGNAKGKKYLYIGISEEFDKGPAIIIADNGPGWRHIEKVDMVKPFRTTKPGGMGIGLYYTSTVMDMIGGELMLLEKDEISGVPAAADGAIVALVFRGGKCRK